MEPKRYATAAAFRRALEDRLQDIVGKESVDLQCLRRQVAFDRLLARLFQAAQPRALPWVLKGGYAMELRIKAARTTKDIDLTMRSVFSSDEKKDDKKNLAVLEKLQEAAAFGSPKRILGTLDSMRIPVSIYKIRMLHSFRFCIDIFKEYGSLYAGGFAMDPKA
jgi:Nucleotidyl transferase AbiEii toxin, Type IV TA system